MEQQTALRQPPHAAGNPVRIDEVQIPTNHPVVAQQPRALALERPVTPADLLQIAMASGDKDLDRLERLMKMAQDWRAEEAKTRFHEDFAAFTGEGIVVPKTKHVQQQRSAAKGGGAGPSYWQSEYHIVSGLLKPALGRHGFGVRFKVEFQRAEGTPWCEVTCNLVHRAGHIETLTLGGPPDDSGAKNPLQEMQSSATFLMRHALLAITGTAQAGQDNDGRGARGNREDTDTSGGPSAETTRLLNEGYAKAKQGTKVLLAWWQSLSQAQREPLQNDFGLMRSKAGDVDKQGGPK